MLQAASSSSNHPPYVPTLPAGPAPPAQPAPDSVAAVSHAVGLQLETGDVRVDSIASLLNLSSRTLQRRLAEQGTTFQEVVDRVRATRAKYYLVSEGLSIREIARRLGFSGAPTFHRAFKKWTGSTPERFRSRYSEGAQIPAHVGDDREGSVRSDSPAGLSPRLFDPELLHT
jgi:AraC-like DNA-binding protein